MTHPADPAELRAATTAAWGHDRSQRNRPSAPTGVSGVGLGVVFGILLFIGFDAATTLGEQTRNPRRYVPLAVAGALGACYVFTGAIGTVAIVIVYLASNVALIRYIGERRLFKHVLVPLLGVAALAYPLYSASKPGQAYPYNYVPWVVLAWIALGIARYVFYRAKSREKIAAIGRFIAEEFEAQPGLRGGAAQ